MEENWKDIKGYEGLYQVSNFGRIKSINRTINHNKGNGNRILNGRILKCWYDKNNYARISLSKNGKVTKYLVHYITASTFIPNPDNKPCIDHIDTNPSNNNVENLRWCTQKENCNNPITKIKMRKNSSCSKPVLQFSKEGELIKKWDSTMDIQRELGISNTCISYCCTGKNKTARGFKWHYHYKSIWKKKHIPELYKKRVVA